MLPTNTLVLLIVLLVPIVPAYLLFKLLPSKAVVTGPLQGLQMNLSGAFAGYFVVFLTLVSTFHLYTGPNYTVWTVEGSILASDQPTLDCTDSRNITFTGDVFRKRTDGNFQMQFIAPDDGSFQYTRMSVNCQDHLPQTIFLGPQEKNAFGDVTAAFDPKRHTVTFKPVFLSHVPEGVASDPGINPLIALSK